MDILTIVIFVLFWTNLKIQAVSLVNNNTKYYVPLGNLRPHTEDDSKEEKNQQEVISSVPLMKFQYLYCEQEQYRHVYIEGNKKSQMLWVTWNRTKAGDNAILPNMCSAHNGMPLKRRCFLDSSNSKAVWEPTLTNATLIQCRQCKYCEAEPFQHLYLMGKDELEPHKNSWKRVKINHKSTLQDVCLKTNGLPLTRQCVYNPQTQKAEWESVEHLKDFQCLSSSQQRIVSDDLNSLLLNMSRRDFIPDPSRRKEMCGKLVDILEQPKQRLLPADIHLSNEILKNLIADTQDSEISLDVLKITHNLMASERTVLRMSAEINATNSLLDTFETYMDSIGDKFVATEQCNGQTFSMIPLNTTINSNKTTSSSSSVELLNFMPIGVYAHVSKNISVFFINPNCANISGIAIYPPKLSSLSSTRTKSLNYDSLNDFHYRFIYLNESANELLYDTDMELAAFVPESIWQHINVHFMMLGKNSVLVFKVYAHDGLFVESNLLRMRKPFSKVLSISIPGYEHTLPGDLPFLLRHNNHYLSASKTDVNSGCAYWNYSSWTSGGVQTSQGNKGNNNKPNSLILCYTNHLTQFSYLIGGNFKQNDLSEEILVRTAHQQALDIISVVGCTLSLMGVVGIWITALMFKSWRSQASNKILLNMCVALTLQMVLFLFVNTDDVSEDLVEQHDYTKCIMLGALLQYTLLVLFVWMLLIAFLQFQRYVTVIGIQRPKHYIAKSAVLAWSIPLIPTLCVVFIDPKSYIPTTYQLVTDSGICYPSGNGLHFGVLLPIGLIVLANLSIFVYVFYSISRTLQMTLQKSEKKLVLKQIRLSILLFFLLGLSWIFGLLAFMRAGIAFSYLFCLTATLQGFVLFVYFVILDATTRESWLKVLYPSYKKNLEKKATELQSMHTASTTH